MRGAYLHLFDLTGRVVIVTGGSGGLGLQIAGGLVDFGASVAIVGRDRDKLDMAVSQLAADDAKVRGFVADLSEDGADEALVDAVLASFGRIDILVNNAGATWGAAAEDYPRDGWDKVMRLNVTSLFALTQRVARKALLPQGGGAILNVASTEGLLGHHPDRLGTVGYNAAKGAVINMTRALAAEWGPRNIRVNALAPGFFPSKMTAATLDVHGAEMIRQTPLGKLGGGKDLIGPALVMVSDAGAHITGQILVVDGGASII